MNKKQIPFDILTAVEPILQENKEIIHNQKADKCYYSIHDKESSSGYFFNVINDPSRLNNNSDGSAILCQFLPKGLHDISIQTVFIKRDQLSNYLNGWVKIIKTYNSTESVYDDPYVRKYQKHYFEEFKIVDEDADTAPFDPVQQDAIDEYLEYVEQKLLEHRQEASADKEFVDELISETRDTGKQLAITTKNKVFTRITTIWAKAYKYNKKLAKDLLLKAREQLISEVVKAGMKYIPSAAKTIFDPNTYNGLID